MKESYPVAIKNVLAHEGGYCNDKNDPGGPTNWGITIFDARKYWKANASAADVKAMPLAVAQSIYDAHYWDTQRCDELPAGVDYSIFDYGVNSGIGRSGKVLRRLVGLSDDTSLITHDVIMAVNKRDPLVLIAAINDERLRFLKSLRTWPSFGKGWGRRVAEVKAVSTNMAKNIPSIAATPKSVLEPAGKGEHPTPSATKIVIAGGAVGVGAGFSLSNWIAAHPAFTVFVGLGVFGLALFLTELMLRHNETKQTAPMPGTMPVPAVR